MILTSRTRKNEIWVDLVAKQGKEVLEEYMMLVNTLKNAGFTIETIKKYTEKGLKGVEPIVRR